MSLNNLFNIDDFHFGDNLFIDASAGTGKTYTIQQLVAKLVAINAMLAFPCLKS